MKFKSRNTIVSGSPWKRPLLTATKRFAKEKVKSRRNEEKDYGNATLGFAAENVSGPEQQTSIFKPIIGPFSKAYKYMFFRHD